MNFLDVLIYYIHWIGAIQNYSPPPQPYGHYEIILLHDNGNFFFLIWHLIQALFENEIY